MTFLFIKQDVTVADCHAVAKVILWEENVGTLQQQHRYTLIQEYSCMLVLGVGPGRIRDSTNTRHWSLDGNEEKLD